MARVIVVRGLAVHAYAELPVRHLRDNGSRASLLSSPAWRGVDHDLERYGRNVAADIDRESAATIAASLTDLVERPVLVSPTIDPAYCSMIKQSLLCAADPHAKAAFLRADSGLVPRRRVHRLAKSHGHRQRPHVWLLPERGVDNPVDGLTTTLIAKLLTNPVAQSQSTAGPGDRSQASAPVHHTGRLSMAGTRSVVGSFDMVGVLPKTPRELCLGTADAQRFHAR